MFLVLALLLFFLLFGVGGGVAADCDCGSPLTFHFFFAVVRFSHIYCCS